MSSRSIVEAIRDAYVSLSKQQQHIASAILDQGNKVAFLTAKELGEKIGVSSATIVRFARKMGYDGYPDMARELQRFFYEDNAPMRKLKESFNSLSEEGRIFDQVCCIENQNLISLNQGDLGSSIDSVVEHMIGAKKVIITGGRTSYCMVHYAGFLLRQLDRKFIYFNSSIDDAYERMEVLEEGDLLLTVSFHRYFRRTRDLSEYGMDLGAHVVALTDNMSSPLVPASHEVLLAPNKAPFYSCIPGMAVLNALVASYAKGLNLSSMEIFDKRSQLLLEKDVYV